MCCCFVMQLCCCCGITAAAAELEGKVVDWHMAAAARVSRWFWHFMPWIKRWRPPVSANFSWLDPTQFHQLLKLVTNMIQCHNAGIAVHQASVWWSPSRTMRHMPCTVTWLNVILWLAKHPQTVGRVGSGRVGSQGNAHGHDGYQLHAAAYEYDSTGSIVATGYDATHIGWIIVVEQHALLRLPTMQLSSGWVVASCGGVWWL